MLHAKKGQRKGWIQYLWHQEKKENTAGAIAWKIIEEYQSQNAEEMQDGRKNTTNHRNGCIHKNVKTAYENVSIDMPRDRGTEGKHYWMQIFDEIKAWGVEDVLFISMAGVSGLEEGAKPIFKDVVVQKCIVHLIRNSIKYMPSKEYKNFTAQLKKVCGVPA